MNTNNDDTNPTEDDSSFREQMDEDGFKADSSGVVWAAAQPKVLVAGAYKVIRNAAERARKITGRGRE